MGSISFGWVVGGGGGSNQSARFVGREGVEEEAASVTAAVEGVEVECTTGMKLQKTQFRPNETESNSLDRRERRQVMLYKANLSC